MCPTCDVTDWVREGQQYSGPGKVPHTEMYEAPESFGKKTQNLKYIYQLYYYISKTSTLNHYPSLTCGDDLL